MKKTLTLLALTALVIFVYSCNKKTDKLTTTAYLDLPATPYEYTQSTWDPAANYKATLGRVLFYDAHLSINNAISCGSCHKQALGFADDAAFSVGYEGRLTKRNTIAINSVSLNGSLFWDGRENNIQNLSLRPITNHVEMGISDMDALSKKLSSLPYYGKLFIDAFGDDQITPTRISTAIASFMTAIVTGTTRFDQYVRGNRNALTAQEIEGMNLFDTKYNCASCHAGSGGYGGGGTFKDIGLDFAYSDMGLGAITGNSQDRGTFKVPNLANVALTAPYMHDGRYKTLSDVLDHYSHGIRSSSNLDTLLKVSGGAARVMNISDREKGSIVAFLGSLTDYGMITDAKFSNPFKVK